MNDLLLQQENEMIAYSNLESGKRKLIRLVTRTQPDRYLIEYDFGAIKEEQENETLEAALLTFDTAIRAGARYALLQALYILPDGTGEAYINLGLHDPEI